MCYVSELEFHPFLNALCTLIHGLKICLISFSHNVILIFLHHDCVPILIWVKNVVPLNIKNVSFFNRLTSVKRFHWYDRTSHRQFVFFLQSHWNCQLCVSMFTFIASCSDPNFSVLFFMNALKYQMWKWGLRQKTWHIFPVLPLNIDFVQLTFLHLIVASYGIKKFDFKISYFDFEKQPHC